MLTCQAADRFADGHVELEALWSPRDVDRLRERLCAAATAERRFRLLEASLHAHLLRPLQRRRALDVALGHLAESSASVADVADGVGLSHRRFIEVFSAEVGMTPKLFLRVQRFQRAFAWAGRESAPQWAQLAARCGYFDQSHLIRDFIEFAGITPAEYARQRSARVKQGHVAVAEPGSRISNTRPSVGTNVDPGGNDGAQASQRSKS